MECRNDNGAWVCNFSFEFVVFFFSYYSFRFCCLELCFDVPTIKKFNGKFSISFLSAMVTSALASASATATAHQRHIYVYNIYAFKGNSFKHWTTTNNWYVIIHLRFSGKDEINTKTTTTSAFNDCYSLFMFITFVLQILIEQNEAKTKEEKKVA